MKKFTLISLLALFFLGAQYAQAESFTYTTGLIKVGVRSNQVRALQACLTKLGQNPSSNYDGIFGPITAGAVKAFQAQYNAATNSDIFVDGIIGPQTGPLYEEACREAEVEVEIEEEDIIEEEVVTEVETEVAETIEEEVVITETGLVEEETVTQEEEKKDIIEKIIETVSAVTDINNNAFYLKGDNPTKVANQTYTKGKRWPPLGTSYPTNDAVREGRIAQSCTQGDNIEIVSGTDAIITETGGNAVRAWTHPNWTANIPGASWIWSSYQVVDTSKTESFTFKHEFELSSLPEEVSFQIAADDEYRVWINGNLVGEEAEHNSDKSNTHAIPVEYFTIGDNTLLVEITNVKAGCSRCPTSNPAGGIYKLTLSGESSCTTRVREISECTNFKQTTHMKERSYEPGMTYWEDVQLSRDWNPFSEVFDAYKIRWYDGSISNWYEPGVGDLDRKYNTTNGLQKHLYAYFQDHTYYTGLCTEWK